MVHTSLFFCSFFFLKFPLDASPCDSMFGVIVR
ncbi:hypothetical protein GLYMA_14G104550v4 [Glycine max]|nr:hypothetical protein GLYMA_14G104550v4 [Glycine max]KAH1093970.1 hypothetical protein GYH30_039622 [Glycine max]